MSFGLTPLNPNPSSHGADGPDPLNKLSLVDWSIVIPPDYLHNPGRIAKSQIRCRRCGKAVEKTVQYGEQSGRRVIVCGFECHGETGEIRICDDQLTADMVFDVFNGEPSLRGHKKEPLALPDNKPAVQSKSSGPTTIEIEAEVIPPPRLTM